MRQFLLLSIIVLTSCGTTYKVADIKEQKQDKHEFLNPYFSQTNKEYGYRFKITFMKKEMKGNFVAKKLGYNSHRVVLTSDFGNTLFDLSVTDHDYKLNYAMEDLNRKVIVKTLAKDLQAIFKNDFSVNERIKTSNQIILKSKDVSLVFDENSPNYYSELIHLHNNKIKTINQFSVNQSDFPDNILIKHNHFNLSIELSKVNLTSEEE